MDEKYNGKGCWSSIRSKSVLRRGDFPLALPLLQPPQREAETNMQPLPFPNSPSASPFGRPYGLERWRGQCWRRRCFLYRPTAAAAVHCSRKQQQIASPCKRVRLCSEHVSFLAPLAPRPLFQFLRALFSARPCRLLPMQSLNLSRQGIVQQQHAPPPAQSGSGATVASLPAL